METKSVMTIEMVADYLNMTVDEVKTLVENRDIPCAQIAGKFLFVRELVLDWVANESRKRESEKWDEPEDEEKKY